jgi:diaminohydroxyphosphoribosylaminopyrimidine deaminase/5-amino-6-(5-phosphoribosylamino)uracil reductase
LNNDEFIMMRCIELAKRGRGRVSPNPFVGSVIIKNGKIVSEGYHRRFGGTHAEINAIASAKRKGLNLKSAALYVNLEPCCHHGKTPPCVDKIIRSGFAKVVIGLKTRILWFPERALPE